MQDVNRRQFLAAATLLLAGCNKNRTEPFPADCATMTLPNGHHLVQNPSYSRPEDMKEDKLVELFQDWRISHGLSTMIRNRALDGLARGHAQHMSEHNFYGHYNPEGQGPTERVNLIAPNTPVVVHEDLWVIALEQDVQTVIDAFVNSPPHYEAFVSNSNLLGVGFWRGIDQYGIDSLFVVMNFVELR